VISTGFALLCSSDSSSAEEGGGPSSDSVESPEFNFLSSVETSKKEKKLFTSQINFQIQVL
jgi:hypothetical protein